VVLAGDDAAARAAAQRAQPREPEPMRTEDGSEVDAPLAVEAPHVDTRARVRTDDVAKLSAQLGVKVVIDHDLLNGVEVHARQPKGVLGYDMTDIEVRVGTSALTSDVLAHARTVQLLQRYNGLLGKLRLLADRLFKRHAAAHGALVHSRFSPGSRGYV